MSFSIDLVKKFILKEYLTGEDPENLTSDFLLIQNGVLDSLAVLSLVDWLEKEFQVKIANNDVNEENFGSLDKIEKFMLAKNV